MKKKNLLITLLSIVMAVSLSVPVVMAFADDAGSTTVPKTLTVEIFNGNADNVTLKSATAADDNGTTVISISNAWSGFIMLKEPVNLSAAKEKGKLYVEYKTLSGKSWGKVCAVTYASGQDEPVCLNGSGDAIGLAPDYIVKSYDFSAVTEAQMAKFKGFALGTSEPFYIKRVWVEYPNPDYGKEDKPTTEGTYNLIETAVSAAQDSTWEYIAEIPSEYEIQKGDKIAINYNIANVPEGGKAWDMWVGEDKIGFDGATKENYVYTQTGTWEYTFKEAHSGNIKFGLWSTGFSIESATLTIIKHEAEVVTGYDIFNGVTEVGEVKPNSANTAFTATYTAEVSGSAVADGSALAFGQFEDGKYYVSGTNAKTATRVTISATDVTTALLFGGTLNFKAKLDFAGENGRYASIRLYYQVSGGEAAFVSLPLTGYTAGEWKDYSIALTDFNVECNATTTWGNAAPSKWFDWTKFVGIGISMGCSDEGDNVASFGDVSIANVGNKTIEKIEVENAKTEYNAGDAFDTDGMKVYVVLNDATKVEIKNYTYSPATLPVGTKTVTVKWVYAKKTYTADIAVNVVAEYTSLRVKTNPTKTAYKAGEKFSAEGMVIVGVKPDESEVEITGYTCFEGMLWEGMTKVDVEYMGMTVAVDITVADFEYKLSLTDKTFAADGEPLYGWTARTGSIDYTSQAKYDAAAEDKKANLRVTGKDETYGHYITADFTSANYATRIFEYGVADYRFGTLYEEPDYNGMVAVTYRTSSVFDQAVNFGLANFSEWNLGFHAVDISGLVVADGEWHTLYIDIGLFKGEIDGMLWAGMSGEVDLNKVVGFAVQSAIDGTLDIAEVSVKWNGLEKAAKTVDTTGPEFEYSGEITMEATEGDLAFTFENESAYDKNDGAVELTIEWSEGSVTDGKLNAGEHTVKLYAVDAAGNKSSVYTVTVNVSAKGVTPPDSGSSVDSGSVIDSGSDSSAPAGGCKSVVIVTSVALVLLALVAVYVIIRKKKQA